MVEIRRSCSFLLAAAAAEDEGSFLDVCSGLTPVAVPADADGGGPVATSFASFVPGDAEDGEADVPAAEVCLSFVGLVRLLLPPSFLLAEEDSFKSFVLTLSAATPFCASRSALARSRSRSAAEAEAAAAPPEAPDGVADEDVDAPAAFGALTLAGTAGAFLLATRSAWLLTPLLAPVA